MNVLFTTEPNIFLPNPYLDERLALGSGRMFGPKAVSLHHYWERLPPRARQIVTIEGKQETCHSWVALYNMRQSIVRESHQMVCSLTVRFTWLCIVREGNGAVNCSAESRFNIRTLACLIGIGTKLCERGKACDDCDVTMLTSERRNIYAVCLTDLTVDCRARLWKHEKLKLILQI